MLATYYIYTSIVIGSIYPVYVFFKSGRFYSLTVVFLNPKPNRMNCPILWKSFKFRKNAFFKSNRSDLRILESERYTKMNAINICILHITHLPSVIKLWLIFTCRYIQETNDLHYWYGVSITLSHGVFNCYSHIFTLRLNCIMFSIYLWHSKFLSPNGCRSGMNKKHFFEKKSTINHLFI